MLQLTSLILHVFMEFSYALVKRKYNSDGADGIDESGYWGCQPTDSRTDYMWHLSLEQAS